MDDGVWTTTEVVDIDAVFSNEGLALPTGIDLGSASVWVLPTMKSGSPLFEGPTADALKIASECDIRARLLSDGTKPRFAVKKAAGIVLPTLLIFAQGALQVPWSMLANYLTSLSALYAPSTRVRSRLYVNEGAGIVEFEYEGPASGLVPALREARKIRDA